MVGALLRTLWLLRFCGVVLLSCCQLSYNGVPDPVQESRVLLVYMVHAGCTHLAARHCCLIGPWGIDKKRQFQDVYGASCRPLLACSVPSAAWPHSFCSQHKSLLQSTTGVDHILAGLNCLLLAGCYMQNSLHEVVAPFDINICWCLSVVWHHMQSSGCTCQSRRSALHGIQLCNQSAGCLLLSQPGSFLVVHPDHHATTCHSRPFFSLCGYECVVESL